MRLLVLFVVFFIKFLIWAVLPSLASFEFSSGLINDLPQLVDADGFDDFVLDEVLAKAWQCPRCECFSKTSWFFREMHEDNLLYCRCKFWYCSRSLLALQGL